MDFRDLLDKRGECGALVGDALKVLKDSQKVPELDGKSDEEIKRIFDRAEAESEFRVKIGGAVKAIAEAVNGRNNKDVGAAIFWALIGQHRTLQAQTVSALIEALRLYKDASYDLRNKAAVVAAEVITNVVEEQGVYIPLI